MENPYGDRREENPYIPRENPTREVDDRPAPGPQPVPPSILGGMKKYRKSRKSRKSRRNKK